MSDEKRITITATSEGLSGATLHVHSVKAIEELNDPYEVSILFHAEGDADPVAALGKSFSIELDRDGTLRRFVGIVKEVLVADRIGANNVVWHQVKVVPALHFLSLRRDTRIFQEKTVLEILQAVLDEALGPFSRSVTVLASATYPKREYCLQYQETDLDFVHRLMEEEGIGYFFDHAGEKEVLTLTDANDQFETVETIGGSTVHFRENENQTLDDAFEPVFRFARARHTTTTSVAVRDYDFTGQEPDASETSADELGRDRESYEHGLGRSLTIGDYSGTAFGANDAARQALLRKEMHLAGGSLASGTSRAIGFGPGLTFSLLDHPIAGMDGDYLVTRVEHAWGDPEAESGRFDYTNSFQGSPLDRPYRPRRRTPKPAIGGPETAIVTGPSGEEIHTDEHGRIKVQFHWDRKGQNDDKTTCFLRVRQPWAGAGWGFVFIPRIGMEVIVDFVAGDPDRPIVDGCVYNADHAVPYPLPDEKTKSTIKSNSSLGGSGFNELRFEDKAGSEEIFTHAQKDQNEIVLANHTTWVGGDQENIVGATQTQKVHQNQTEHVKGNSTMDVGTDRTVHVKASFTETISVGELVEIDGGVTETITAFESRTVTGGLEDKITGGELRLVGGTQQENITGTHNQHVLGPNTEIFLAGSKQTVTAGPITFHTSGAHDIKSGGPIAFTGTAGIREAATEWEEVIDNEWKFDPILHKGELNQDWKHGANSMAFYISKNSAYGGDLSNGNMAVGIFGATISEAGLKMSAAAVKIDLFVHKGKLKAIGAAPLQFEVTL